MKVTKIPGLGSVGIYIDQVDFDHLTSEEWAEIGALQVKNLVTIIRNTNLSFDQYPQYIRQLGTVRYNNVVTLLRKYNKTIEELQNDSINNGNIMSKTDKEILKLGMKHYVQLKTGGAQTMSIGFDSQGKPDGWFADGDLDWHVDEPGLLDFIAGASLYGVNNMVGSATAFVNTIDAYENFSNSFRSELNDMLIHNTFDVDRTIPGSTHKVSIDAIESASVPEPDHAIPLVIQSPGGHIGLHYSPCNVNRVVGMTDAQSQQVFQTINQEVFKKQYLYEHWYQQNNDLVLYDNSVLFHRRLGNPLGRKLYRISCDYYTSTTKKFYQPYVFHSKKAREYIRRVDHTVKLAGLTDFNRPSWTDWLKTFV